MIFGMKYVLEICGKKYFNMGKKCAFSGCLHCIAVTRTAANNMFTANT